MPCPHCDTPTQPREYLPIEPTFTVRETAEMLGLTVGALRWHLHEHPEITAYYVKGYRGRLTRVLFASQVRHLIECGIGAEGKWQMRLYLLAERILADYGEEPPRPRKARPQTTILR
jgi:hypothetical protein